MDSTTSRALAPRPARRTRMVLAAISVLALSLVSAFGGAVTHSSPAAAADNQITTTLPGVDVSHYQGTINWTAVHNAGIKFAYIKATEGTTYRDPQFSANYLNAYNAGVIRGAYHFGRPDGASGATQANYFADHGGAWSADGKTLPGTLDIEYGPNSTCYGLSQASMRSWITSFVNQYHARTTRWPVIYSTTDWWTTCTGNYSGFAANCPLWLARYNTTPGTLPAGWSFWTFWQYTSTGSVSGISGNVDRNWFNGDSSRLLALANNTP